MYVPVCVPHKTVCFVYALFIFWCESSVWHFLRIEFRFWARGIPACCLHISIFIVVWSGGLGYLIANMPANILHYARTEVNCKGSNYVMYDIIVALYHQCTL